MWTDSGTGDKLWTGDRQPAAVQVLEHVKRNVVLPQSVKTHQRMTHPQTEPRGRRFRHVTVMWIGLDARSKCKVGSDWKIAEWITKLAGELLNRSQDGKDSWTDHSLYVWHSTTDCRGGRRAGGVSAAEQSKLKKEAVVEGTVGLRNVDGH